MKETLSGSYCFSRFLLGRVDMYCQKTLSLKRSVLAPVSLRRPRKGRSALIGQNNDCALLLPSDGLIQQVFCG